MKYHTKLFVSAIALSVSTIGLSSPLFGFGLEDIVKSKKSVATDTAPKTSTASSGSSTTNDSGINLDTPSEITPYGELSWGDDMFTALKKVCSINTVEHAYLYGFYKQKGKHWMLVENKVNFCKINVNDLKDKTKYRFMEPQTQTFDKKQISSPTTWLEAKYINLKNVKVQIRLTFNEFDLDYSAKKGLYILDKAKSSSLTTVDGKNIIVTTHLNHVVLTPENFYSQDKAWIMDINEIFTNKYAHLKDNSFYVYKRCPNKLCMHVSGKTKNNQTVELFSMTNQGEISYKEHKDQYEQKCINAYNKFEKSTMNSADDSSSKL